MQLVKLFPCLGALLLGVILADPAMAAYHHMGEIDSDHFLQVYPARQGKKLDSCALCHTGGSYIKSGKTTTLGSCQWCHYKYGYDKSGNIMDTLNAYGKDYLAYGRSVASVQQIANLDSDGDGYSNITEINADSFPGSAADNPSLLPAPSRVFNRAELSDMPHHTQFMVMNTSKSGDYYAEYSGVTIRNILAQAGMLDNAQGVTVFSPDGFSQYHPLDYSLAQVNSVYPVNGGYPAQVYRYSEEADQAKSQTGWCDYSAKSVRGRSDGQTIDIPGGPQLLLAMKRDGVDLSTGVLTLDNKLDGEGPYRVVAPQIVPGPPDQHSTAQNQNVIWPYNSGWDHNAGVSSRAVTILRIEPLPAGTTDIDLLEAGWNYIDQGKIIVYGAIDPQKACLKSAKGNIDCSASAGRVTRSEVLPADDDSLPQDGRPRDRDFPYGAMKFDIAGLPVGGSVTLTLTFPDNVPRNARFYKIGAAGIWNSIPFGSNDGDRTITVTLTDGDPLTDADGLANGIIVDPGALGLSNDGDGGCVLGRSGEPSVEWLCLLLVPAIAVVRRWRARG